jgi:hypothetical protein
MLGLAVSSVTSSFLQDRGETGARVYQQDMLQGDVKHLNMNLIFMVPCIIILNLIKTSLMHSSSVLLRLNALYVFRMLLASILRSINMYMQVVQESARVVICSPARSVPIDCVVVGSRANHYTVLHPKHVERIKA